MRYLSLFTGAGGGDLAYQHFLGWECIGYVEWDTYCQRVIRQRIDDGVFDRAPIFGDVREFVQSGAADEYRGFADVVTGGFPCQPFSVAGKRAGADDERNMWPATLAAIRTIRPRYAFLENVPGLLTSGYFGRILGDLVESGYDTRWRILSAAEVGAPHKRDRLWIVAHANRCEPRGWQQSQWGPHRGDSILAGDGPQGTAPDVDNTIGNGRAAGRHDYRPDDRHLPGAASQHPAPLADPESLGPLWDRDITGSKSQVQQRADIDRGGEGSGEMADTQGQSFGAGLRKSESTQQRGGRFGDGSGASQWWDVEPGLDRVANGVAYRSDRLKAIGNGMVPAVAATAWHLLTEDWRSG